MSLRPDMLRPVLPHIAPGIGEIVGISHFTQGDFAAGAGESKLLLKFALQRRRHQSFTAQQLEELSRRPW